TASMISATFDGSAIRATPPSLRMSAGTRSRAMTAQAPASSAILAWSAVVTSMITPPFSISASPVFTRSVPVSSSIGTPPEPGRRSAGWSSVISRNHAHLLGHPADRPQAPWQLPGRHPRLRGGAGPRRRGVLHRRPARPYGKTGPGRAPPEPVRHDGDPARGRPGPRALHPVSPVRRTRAHGALLGARDRRLLRRAVSDDPVQGEVGPAQAVRLLGTVLLPGAAGRRHPRLRHR